MARRHSAVPAYVIILLIALLGGVILAIAFAPAAAAAPFIPEPVNACAEVNPPAPCTTYVPATTPSNLELWGLVALGFTAGFLVAVSITLPAAFKAGRRDALEDASAVR